VNLALLKAYALQFVGLPYRWGGDDPMDGFDCSGLVQEVLQAAGIDPPGDQTAHGLYTYFKTMGLRSGRELGALAFYGSREKITHVGFCLDSRSMLEAGGGGSKTTSLEGAAKQNAYIRIRPIEGRKDLVTCIVPDYFRLGL
jgi:cell wall-associated NlpC family hydrolase